MKLAFASLVLLVFGLVSPSYADWAAHYYPNDFDGDKISDLCVWRPSTGEWFCVPSSGQVIPGWTPVGAGPGSKIQWGLPGDIPASADYDGDLISDPAVIRPGTMNWYVRKSTGGTMVVQHGLGTDVPFTGVSILPAFTDDFAVYRASTDRIYCKKAGGSVSQWSVTDYIAGTHGSFGYFFANFVHQYTKSGSNLVRVRRTSCTNGVGGSHLDYSLPTAGYLTAGAYAPGDVQYDYAHFLNNVWTIYSLGGQYALNPLIVTWGWGLASDIPVTGDFDGDSRADLAVYNNGAWRVYSSGYFYGSPPPHMQPYGNPADYWFQWGQAGDIPIQ